MKRRLFAAAMAMTMVIGASVPVMAETFNHDKDNGNAADYEINVKGKVVGSTTSTREADDYVNHDDANTDVWNVEIQSDNFALTYELDKNVQTYKKGNWGVEWNTDTREYTTHSNSFDTNHLYTLHSNETGERTFTIRNNSNFALGVDYSVVAGNVDASAALTGLTNRTIAVADDTVTETVTLVPSLIPTSVNISDETTIGNINIELTAGDRKAYTP